MQQESLLFLLVLLIYNCQRFFGQLMPCSEPGRSVENAALVGRNHVLDVDEGVITSMLFEKLERFLNQVAQVYLFPLRIVNAVAAVPVVLLEKIHDGQDLAVIRHQSLANCITAHDKSLQHMQSSGDNIWIP